MEKPFSQLLEDIYDFAPPLRKKKLAAFWLGLSSDEQQALKAELDSKLSSFEITPYDYAFLLRLSKSVDWSLHALKAFEHKVVLETGISTLVSAWKKDSHALETAFEGNDVEGMVQLIDTELPRYITSRLFRHLANVSSLTPQHFHLVDGILKAIFPFVADGLSTPIMRYAKCALLHLFMVASPSVLFSIIKQCATEWFDRNTWSRLAKRRPELVADLLLHHVDAPRLSPITSSSAVLDFKVHSLGDLFSTMGIIIRHTGPLFFTKFISHYTTFVEVKSASKDAAFHTNRIPLADLAKHMSFVIGRERGSANIIRVALAQCDILAKVARTYGQPEWPYKVVRPLMDVAVDLFRKAVGEWSLLSSKDYLPLSGSQSATGLLLSLFKQLDYKVNSLSTPDPLLIKALRRLPRPARFPFLNYLHIAKAGEDLYHMPSSPKSYPQCSGYILSIIHPEHARTFLDIGSGCWHNDFIVDHEADTPDASAFTTLWQILRTADAISAGLHAVRIGSARTILRGFNLDQDDSRCLNDIEEYKKKASRSRDSRLVNVRAALTLCILSRSPGLFIDTLSWATKRYGKDPQVSPQLFQWIVECTDQRGILNFLSGPPGLYVNHRIKVAFDLHLLANWCQKTNETIRCIIDLLHVWVSEPYHVNRISREYDTLGEFFYYLIQRRIDIINAIFPVLVDDLTELRGLLLDPLVDLWVQWERMKVFDYPQLLGFDSTQNIPCFISWYDEFVVDLRVLPAILPFLESIGEERDKLYREGRAGFPKELDNATIESKRENFRMIPNRHFLPVKLVLRGNFEKHEALLNLTGPLGSYIDAVLMGSQIHMKNHDDCYDWHPLQFCEALETYLTFSKKGRHQVSKICTLLRTYRGMDHGDCFAMQVLRSATVRGILWQDSELCGHLRAFLPGYPSQNVEQLDFDPLSLMRPHFDLQTAAPGLLITLRNSDAEDAELLNILLAFRCSSGPRSIRGASLKFIHQLIVFIFAWIFTILDIPRSNNDVLPRGPVGYALKYVRMTPSFMELSKLASSDYRYRHIDPCSLLGPLLPMVSLSEIEQLLEVTFSSPVNPNNRRAVMSIMSAIRRLSMPNLQRKQAFRILEDTDASSWHRQVVTNGMIASFRPPQAKEYIYQLFQFCQDRRAQQKIQGQSVTDPQSGGPSSGPAIKTSTQKMLLQLLVPSLRTGALDYHLINDLSQVGLLETSTAIISYLVETFIESAITSFVLSGNGDVSKGVQNMLAPFIEIAQRLDEEVAVSEEDWDAAQRGVGPMPENVETRPIAKVLLGCGVDFKSSVKHFWATHVVKPILEGHINVRTRWLKAAVVREHGPSDLEEAISASWGEGLEFSYTCQQFASHLSSRPDDSEVILQALSRRALAFLERESCLKLLQLMASNHPEGWEHQPYGKTLTSLTIYATHSGSALDALATLVNCMRNPSMPPALAEKHLSCLMHIGSILLSPENVILPVHYLDQTPFITVHRIVKDQTMSYVDTKIDRLLAYLLEIAEDHERQQSQEKVNGGAIYWQLILSLKLVLLHHTMGSSTISRTVPLGEQYAKSLAALVNHVSKNRWYHAGFPHKYADYLGCTTNDKMHIEDFILACRRLSQTPLCTSEMGTVDRTLFLETAVAVLRAHRREIESSTTGAKLLEELLSEWKEDPDGALHWLALSWRKD